LTRNPLRASYLPNQLPESNAKQPIVSIKKILLKYLN